MRQGIRTLVEQALAVVFRWKALGEPGRQTCRRPTVEVQHRLLHHVLAYAVPIKRRLAAHMQAIEPALGAKRRPYITFNVLIYIVIKYAKAIFIPTLVPKSKALPSELTSVSKIKLQRRM